MRKSEEINKPYITIEVRGENLKQYKGFGNRLPNDEEMKFIHKWCDNKGIAY